MNNFLKNQIRRANCALTTKAVLAIIAMLKPNKIWRAHVEKMQGELDIVHNAGCYPMSYLELHPSRCAPATRVPIWKNPNPEARDIDYRRAYR